MRRPDERDLLVAELRAENEALRRDLARERIRDPRTGLWACRHFDELLAYEWKRAERFWTPLSLVFAEIVDLRAVAGAAGSEEAERVLSWMGAFLRGSCRDVDLPCRVGAATFGILLPGTNRTGAEAEVARLDRLLDRAAVPVVPGVAWTLGFGIAVAFDDAETPLDLVTMAGEALLLRREAERAPESRTEPVRDSQRPTLIDAA
jgi:diguanylate cyclase (GGDEF)-like protein